MTIWIAAALFMGLGGAIGVSLGAIRASMVFVGAFFGAMLAVPLGSILRPLIPKIGLPHPFWSWTLPPIIFFVVVVLIFFGLSFAVHRPVALFYKYKVDDYQRRKWERLNQRLGVAPGILTGLIAFLVLGVFCYVVGYTTMTFSSETEEPMTIRLVNSLRADMPSSGFDRLIAPFDPAPAKYYPVVDTLGFIYHNLPKSRERIANYPPLYALGERSEIQDFINDKEFQDALDRKMPFLDLVNHPRTLGFLTSPDLTESLRAIDLKDFREFLESGKSAAYDSFNILGRWDLDADQVIIQTKKSRPDITSSEMSTLKKVLSTLASGTYFKAFYDNKFKLVMNGDFSNLDQLKQAVLAVEAAAQATNAPPAAAAPEGDGGVGYDYNRRYGINMRRGRGQTEPAPEEAAPPPAPKIETKTFEGNWEGEGDSYIIKIQDVQGKNVEMTTRIQADEIVLAFLGQKLVFVKQ